MLGHFWYRLLLMKGLTQSEQALIHGSSVQSETALSDGEKSISAKNDRNNGKKKRAGAVRQAELQRRKAIL